MYYYYTYREDYDKLCAQLREAFTRRLVLDQTPDSQNYRVRLDANRPIVAHVRRTCHDGHTRKDRA